MKIFIGSSLRDSFPFMRTELKTALIRLNFEVMMWEKDKPGGVEIPKGEEFLISESQVCVFLLGSQPSEGTLEEYNISIKLEKFIVLVDATLLDGEKAAMDSELKRIWEQSREEKIITLKWTQSDEVARQILNGIKTTFQLVNDIESKINLELEKTKVEREQGNMRFNFSISLKNSTSKTIQGVELILSFHNYAFHWMKTIFPSPAGPDRPYEYKWSRIDDSKYRLKCLSKPIFPSAVESLGSISLLLPIDNIRILFSCKLYGDNITPPIEGEYKIEGFVERLDLRKR